MFNTYRISNEQAFRALVAGNKAAKAVILANFEHFIRARAGHHFVTNFDEGLDFNELILVGKTALTTAIYTYKGDVESFASYATIVISNAMSNFMKKFRSPTARITRFGLSLDDFLFDDNTSLLVSDSIADFIDPESLGFYEPHAIGYFHDLLPVSLGSLEVLVMEEKLNGLTYQEIQAKHNIPKRKLDRTIAQIKEKFRPK